MNMTPEQALQLLLNASSNALLMKKDHVACEEAVKILKALVDKSKTTDGVEFKQEQ